MINNPFSPAIVMRLVIVAWLIAIVGVFIRVGISHQHTVYPIYENAAHDYMHSQPMYRQNAHTPNGYVYSPLAAAFFVPLALLPQWAGEIIWRLIGLAVCLSGIQCWLMTTGRRFLDPRHHGLFYLILLPLFLDNINNGQANIHMTGLLIWAVVAVDAEAWMLAALCIAAATYLKVYPLAIGLLLAALYPRKFAWRLVAAVVGLGVFSLFLQHPSYVAGQYKLWLSTRLSEDRHTFDYESVPHDLFMLLNFLGCHLSKTAYKLVEVATGGFVAVICLRARLRNWPQDSLLNLLLGAGCSYLLFCGPSSESATYLLIAPFVTFELLHCFTQPVPSWRRFWIAAVFVIYAGSFTIRPLTPLRNPEWMVSQPLSAVLFYCYYAVLAWTAGEGVSQETPGERGTAAAGAH